MDFHIDAKIKAHPLGGMRISGTIVAVNSAGVFNVFPPINTSASSSAEAAGTYTFTLPPYGPNDGSAPSITVTAGDAAINAIIAGTGGNDIVIPGSTTYMVSGPIAIPSGKTLRAATGTTVVVKAAAGYADHIFTMVFCSNSSLKNITVDGNWTQRSAQEGAAAYSIMITGGSSNTVEHCEFTNCPTAGVWSYNSNNLTTQYNQFSEVYQPVRIDGNGLASAGSVLGNNILNTAAFKSVQGIEIVNSKRAQIWHNTVAGIGLQEPTSHGFEGTWGNSIYIYNSDAYHVENNTLNASYWSSLVCGQNSTNVNVIHNYLSRGTFGSQSFWFEQGGADVLTLNWNLMDGGMLAGDGGGNHMTMMHNVMNTIGVGIDLSFSFKFGTIQYNVFNRIAGTDNGIYLFGKDTPPIDIQILDNTFVNFTQGIWINNLGGVGTVYGLTILGNTFQNCTNDIDWPAAISIDSATCNIQGYTPAPPAPAPPPMPAIITNRHPNDLLQVGNPATDTYFIEDNRQVFAFTESTSGTSTFMQKVERALSVGANGEIAFRAQWRWPVSVGGVLVDGGPWAEVKGFPSVIYGARPGIQGPDRYPAWEKAVRLPDGAVVSAAPGGAPANLVSDWVMPGGSVSTTVPSGPTPGSDLPRQLPLSAGTLLTTGSFTMSATGRCHLSFDIWLQDPGHPEQAFGFMNSPITHEIMIPLRNFGNYGRHGFRGQTWDHDVTIDSVTYHVYIASNLNRDDTTGSYTATTYAGLRYNFNSLNPTFTNEETGAGRIGWKFIIFQHDGTAHPLLSDSSFSIDVSKFLNHLTSQVDSRGIPWVQGTEHVVSMELGVEMVYGEGDLTVWNYRTRVPGA